MNCSYLLHESEVRGDSLFPTAFHLRFEQNPDISQTNLDERLPVCHSSARTREKGRM